MDSEKVVNLMLEFDAALPQDVKNTIVENDADYVNYESIIRKLDELYLALEGFVEEDPAEVRVELIRRLQFFEEKYDVDVRYFQKMLLS